MNQGKLSQIIGAVVDVEFPPGQLPSITNALQTAAPDGSILTLEVSAHLGDNIVRAVAMAPTDGLVRGMDAKDTGSPITVPVGPQTLGRIFNLLGEPVDGKDQLAKRHQSAS